VRRERPYGGRWGEDGEGGRNDTGTDDLPTDWPSGTYADYDAATVTVRSPEDDDLGAVRAAIADTREKRYLGLSDATSLPEKRRDAVRLLRAARLAAVRHARDGLRDRHHLRRRRGNDHSDPQRAGAERTDGSEQRYPGSGQYVLEVPYKWTDRNGIEVGDTLAFDL